MQHSGKLTEGHREPIPDAAIEGGPTDRQSEALTARYWPELTLHLDLHTAALLEMLMQFGGPAGAAAAPASARELMARVGGSRLDPLKIEAVVGSAAHTSGMPQLPEEVALVRMAATETRRNQQEQRVARRRVEGLAMSEASTERLQVVIGKTTAAVVVAAIGDPTNNDSPQALVKGLGLNLKERSSSKKQNRGLTSRSEALEPRECSCTWRRFGCWPHAAVGSFHRQSHASARSFLENPCGTVERPHERMGLSRLGPPW